MVIHCISWRRADPDLLCRGFVLVGGGGGGGGVGVGGLVPTKVVSVPH